MDAFLGNLQSVLESVRLIDFIDILAVAFIIYYAVRLVRETRAMQLVKSIGVIFLIYFVSSYLDMITLNFILKTVLDVGLIMLVVLFQPEIRRALERIGRSRLTDIGRFGFGSFADDDDREQLIDVLVGGCSSIISRGDGALIVVENTIRLGDIINTGTLVDAVPSVQLLGNIFWTNSPLHDGATVIRNGRIVAAGCFLPLSDNDAISKELGTRHRAALGVSEVSDAVTIVVSEERGTISVAKEGKLKRDMSPIELRSVLEKEWLTPEQKEKIDRQHQKEEDAHEKE